MARYVKHFKTESEFNTERNGHYIEPWLSVTDGKGLDYNKSEYQKLLETPLTFEILSDGYINWEKIDDNEKPVGNKTISYIKNDGESIQLTKSTQISVVTGDIVKFFGNIIQVFHKRHLAGNEFGTITENSFHFSSPGLIRNGVSQENIQKDFT